MQDGEIGIAQQRAAADAAQLPQEAPELDAQGTEDLPFPFGEGSEEEEEFIGEDALDFEEALAAPDDVQQDPYYFVRTYKTARGDVWHASRIGDTARVKELLEEGTDPNQRDRWDSTPLYYACLAGHLEVAECLLRAGASCSEYTFDGERCFYVALTAAIRQLLGAYAQRPPPLPPLAASLRALSTLCEDTEAQVAPPISPGQWADFEFRVQGTCIPLHRAILAARAPYFRDMLRGAWQPRVGEDRRVVELEHELLVLHPAALRCLLVWCYTDRLDVGIEDVLAVKRLAKRARCRELVAALEAEQRTLKYYFKTVRKEEQPRRFVLQPSALPEEARLSAHLAQLLKLCEAAAAGRSPLGPSDDYADVCLRVDGRLFRCHRCVLAARSDYFAALFKRMSGFEESSCEAASNAATELPVLDIGGVSARAFSLLLRFAYTDQAGDAEGRLPGWLLRTLPDGATEVFDAADRFLLFSLKREVAEVLITRFEQRPQLQGGLEGICRLLLAAELYAVPLLRWHCLHRLAARFDALAARVTPRHESDVFAEFILEVAPEEADFRDAMEGAGVTGASKGEITGGGLGGVGVGTLLQDLREAYLEDFGGIGEERDRCADTFDAKIERLAAIAYASRQQQDYGPV